ncbi:MAG: ergothioneine biosynthesis protein EgtB [Bacteroidetes bacterium]|nr:ergothioneine biosynthesis protein EgtB [Bacteroidota bacterium]
MKIFQQYLEVRKQSEQMCAPLVTEDYLLQPAFFTSPPKWNLGHTSWFFEEMILTKFSKDYKPFHPKYSFIFNSYYNTVGERVGRDQRGDLSRPTVEEVYQYRKYVDEHMEEFIKKKKPGDDIHALIVLGLNHEQQHQELFFTDLKFAFSINPLFPAYAINAFCESKETQAPAMIRMDEGVFETGYNGDGFCFDNELGRHKVYLHPFEISNKLVTNGEFLDFIESGGYNRHDLWHDEGWAWIKDNQIEKPLYWQKEQGKWYQYTLAGLRKLNPDDILTHITYYEAFAFAQWKNLRLPTEFEWEAASDKFNWGLRWEWTESAYLPYPGYNKAEGAVGEYNGKFMVNQKVLRGGSVVTPKGHARKTYRNFFHPQMAWQFNGIRLAK